MTERKEKFKKEQEEKERLKKEDEEKEKQLLKMILEQRSLHLENTVCTQSSVCSNDFSAFGPENALGGLDNFCQTEREFQPWWEIDLGAIYSIQLIRIFNREDEEWQKKLCNFWVLVSQVPFQLSTEPLRFLNLAAEVIKNLKCSVLKLKNPPKIKRFQIGANIKVNLRMFLFFEFQKF